MQPLSLFIIVTLAFSVLSSPTFSPWDLGTSHVFDQNINAFANSRPAIEAACKRGSQNEVEIKLKELYQPFSTLVNTFGQGKEYSSSFGLQLSEKFSSLLTRFDRIVRIIFNYPQIHTKLHRIIPLFDLQFNLIFNQFQKFGFDIRAFLIKSGLEWFRWGSLGFNFPANWKVSSGNLAAHSGLGIGAGGHVGGGISGGVGFGAGFTTGGHTAAGSLGAGGDAHVGGHTEGHVPHGYNEEVQHKTSGY